MEIEMSASAGKYRLPAAKSRLQHHRPRRVGASALPSIWAGPEPLHACIGTPSVQARKRDLSPALSRVGISPSRPCSRIPGESGKSSNPGLLRPRGARSPTRQFHLRWAGATGAPQASEHGGIMDVNPSGPLAPGKNDPRL